MKNLSNIYLKKHQDTYKSFQLNKGESIAVYKDEPLELFLLVFQDNVHVKIDLKEPQASCQIHCVYLMGEQQKVQICLDVNHEAKQTKSVQLIRGIATHQSEMKFDGIIRMPQDSQKCVGIQNHRAILLSDKATVQSTPELEIYADDVQCTHGSAIGPLDKEQVFYLTSRGIEEKQAYYLLLSSFLNDLLPLEVQSIAMACLHDYI